MDSLSRIKVAIKKFIGRNDALIIPVIKFLLVFIALMQINGKLGFMARLNSAPITLIIALAGSFLPLNLTIVILGLIIVAHVYALSLECAIVVLALFLVMFLLYFRFAAKDSYAGILTPLSFVFKMPYVMPISMGLVGEPTSLVAVGSGVVIYQVLHYISENAENLTSSAEESKLGQFKIIIDALVGNRTMIALVVAFSIATVVVYLIRKLPIKYAWTAAIGAGEVTLLVVALMAGVVLDADINFGGLFIGVIISTVINLILQYFLFDLNYNKIEKLQFEDDEYYYYVKAVPKNEIIEDEPIKKTAKRKMAPSRMQDHRPQQRRPVQQKSSETSGQQYTRPGFQDNTKTSGQQSRQSARPQSQQPQRTQTGRPLAQQSVRPQPQQPSRPQPQQTIASQAQAQRVAKQQQMSQAERTAAAMNRVNNKPN
ncbi:MAG: hypothetical protein MJ107_01970 [Lachnospiraceae bacterium]|nr:hypothetical protein [Lachnospiraceae bacterium]